MGTPWIIGNRPEPVPATDRTGPLVADVAPLAAGAPILGVGVEVSIVGASASKRWLEVMTAIPQANLPADTAFYVQSDGASTTIYQRPIGLIYEQGDGPSVGMIAVGGGARSVSIGASTASSKGGAAFAVGQVVRIETVFGGSTTYYSNGASQNSVPTPAAVDATHTVVGAHVMGNGNFATDDWRVGVLT